MSVYNCFMFRIVPVQTTHYTLQSTVHVNRTVANNIPYPWLQFLRLALTAKPIPSNGSREE